MAVTGYDIDASRPIAPSEGKRNWAGLARRVVGSAGVGGLAGAALGKYTGAGAGYGGALGAALGAAHGGLKHQEHTLSDQTTQERMEMRRGLSDYKKQQAKEKKSMIDPVSLNAMQHELLVLHKEAALTKEAFPGLAGAGKMLKGVGEKIIGGASKGLAHVATKGGRMGGAANKAHNAMSQGVVRATKALGGNEVGMGRLKKTLGGAAVGTAGLAGLGAAGAGAHAVSGRRRQ